jgi:hypothetical protein
VEVTFWIADPPAVSFYTFHCFKPPPISDSDSEDAADDSEVQPHVDVVGAEGRFVLVRTMFAPGDHEYEYFIYKGDPKSPPLESGCQAAARSQRLRNRAPRRRQRGNNISSLRLLRGDLEGLPASHHCLETGKKS